MIQNVISTVNNATNAVANNLSALGNSPSRFYNSQGFNNQPGYNRNPQVNNFMNGNSANNFVGNDKPLSHEDIDILSEKHDQYIELIL